MVFTMNDVKSYRGNVASTLRSVASASHAARHERSLAASRGTNEIKRRRRLIAMTKLRGYVL